MGNIPFIKDNSFNNEDQFKQWTHRSVKVVLDNLDGTQSEVKLTWPKVSNWGDDAEIANLYISQMIEHWTKLQLKISAYQVFLGSINKDGQEHYSIYYDKIEIPVGKVFMPSKQGIGKWVPFKDAAKNAINRESESAKRKGNIYLKPCENGEAVTEFNYNEAIDLAFDATLSNDEAKEFQDEITKAKLAAQRSGLKEETIKFFVRPETGSLGFYFTE